MFVCILCYNCRLIYIYKIMFIFLLQLQYKGTLNFSEYSTAMLDQNVFWSGDYESYNILGSDAVYSGRGSPTFWRNVLSPASGSKNKPSKKSRKNFFFLVRLVGGGVQLGPLGTSATNWPSVPSPGDYEYGEFCGMMIGRVNRSTRRKPAPVPICPPQIRHDLTGREPGLPRWKDSD
jgi:hypothetical protein